MAGVHISLGRETLRGPFHVIYVGESAAAAREAEAKSPLPWLVRIDNPPVVRKHNAFAEANALALAVEPVAQWGATDQTDRTDQTDLGETVEAPARGRKK